MASLFLKESLGRIGTVGCGLCLIGSIVIVLHSPADKEIRTVDEILQFALQPGMSIMIKSAAVDFLSNLIEIFLK